MEMRARAAAEHVQGVLALRHWRLRLLCARAAAAAAERLQRVRRRPLHGSGAGEGSTGGGGAGRPKARRRAEGAFCVHGRRRRYDCRECGGSAFCVHGRRRRTCRECGVQETVARHASTPRTVLQQAPTEGMMDGEGWDALAGELFTEVDWESKLHAW